MTWTVRTAAAAVAFVLAFPGTAVAAQMDADERPTTSGPIATDASLKRCASETLRNEEKGNEVAARFRVCNRYLLFDPASEDDTERDYGAFWVQLNADAARGYCIKAVKIVLDDGPGIHAKAPKPGSRNKGTKKRRATTKLTVDAQDHATTEAVVKNSYTLFPGTMTTRMRSGKYRLQWTGSARAELAFAAGLEISWATGTDAPDANPRVRARVSQDC